MTRKSSKGKHSGKLSIVTVCRCVAIAFASCLMFLAVALFTISLVMHPERYIQVSAPPASATEAAVEPGQDPNWDGALAGAGIGYSYGGYFPFLGAPVTALLGGIIGYQLDKSI